MASDIEQLFAYEIIGPGSTLDVLDTRELDEPYATMFLAFADTVEDRHLYDFATPMRWMEAAGVYEREQARTLKSMALRAIRVPDGVSRQVIEESRIDRNYRWNPPDPRK
ncbi:MAG: hypothetical protein ABEN55_00325 [Bradymonadaceae bacterium]